MISSFGELGVEIDFGRNAPGTTLQRIESDVWYDYLIDGVLVTNPVDVEKGLYSSILNSDDIDQCAITSQI